MKKIKLLMFGLLSVLTLGLFVVSVGRIDATSVTEATGCSETKNGKTNTYVFEPTASNGFDNGDKLFDIYIATSSGSQLHSSKYFKQTDGSVVYIPVPASTSAGNITFTVASKKSDRYYQVDTLTRVAPSSGTASFTFTASNVNESGANAETYGFDYYLPVTVSGGELRTTRIVITLTSSDSFAAESTVFVAKFKLNGGTGTAPTDIEVEKTATDKTITLPTTTSTNPGFEFGGWNDGTKTYASGASYTLSADTEFTAVWNPNPTAIDGFDFNYKFENASGNGKEIVIESGQIYSNSDFKAIKMQAATKIHFKTNKAYTIKLVFDNYQLGNGIKIDSTKKTIDTTTCSYIGEIAAGEHLITRGDGENRLKEIILYNTTITPAEASTITVTPLVQPATDSTYTYVRFITIVSGVNEFDATDVKFQITMKYTDTQKADKTNTYTPHVVKRITSGGNTYSEGGYTFGNETNQYYVVYVARFTTATFDGSKVCGTVSFNGNSYTSDLEEI